MESKIKIENVLDKYIIVVDGNEKKVVYDVDDSSIFSVHITGCGRGARNAVLSKNTFKSLKNADKGIKYLNTCYWNCKFKAIKVSELKELSNEGFNYLTYDIEEFNSSIDYKREIAKDRRKDNKERQSELTKRAILLAKSKIVLSITSEDNEIIIRLSGSD